MDLLSEWDLQGEGIVWVDMDDLYREVIIEHYKNPGYRGHLEPHNIQFEDSNPLCGDHIEITLQTDENGNVPMPDSMGMAALFRKLLPIC